MQKNIDFEIKSIVKSPFSIFKIDNFFNDEEYLKISNELPTLEELHSLDLKIYNKKYYFNSEDIIYKKIIKNSSALMNLNNKVFSKDFISFLFKKLYFQILLSRKNDLLSIFDLIKKPEFHIENQALSKSFFKLKIRPVIEFSYISNEGKVVPHTDNRTKLVSMLTYFPYYKNDSKYYKNEKEIGTEFWFSNINNYTNIHLKEQSAEDLFRKKSKLIYKTSFEPKTLFGFVKSSNSWHSVKQFNLNKDYVRRSVNIFLTI